ncbi:uncharacterized protein LOC114938337 [Nylanderia fulva]|uniref:uncharacterized protein LOC114938337 n=1 Tax=Nylanderia fulva TaxID=613905 RepID=UPI0010FADC1E|nr:uncharacterized protein LOC114938337 [Nylanderia fulva]
MAGRIQLIFLFSIVALVLSELALKEKNLCVTTRDGEKVVILDDKIDELLPVIRELIIENGLDPAKVPNMTEDVLPVLPGKLKIVVELTKGILQNLSTIKRTERILGIYKNKVLTLDMNLGFDVLDCSYAYALRVLLLGRTGDTYGRFYDLDINIVARIDMVNYYVYLDSLKFSDVRKLDIKFEGHLLDPILNTLTKAVTRVFKNRILTIIEKRSLEIFNEKIDEWNNQFPRPNLTWIGDIDNWIDNLNKC